MSDSHLNEQRKYNISHKLNSTVKGNLIPLSEKLIVDSAILNEKFKLLNENIIFFLQNDKNYKINQIFFKNKLNELQNLELAWKEKNIMKLDFSNILECYMIIIRNIMDLLNKRIEQLELRDKNNMRKDLILLMFKEKKENQKLALKNFNITSESLSPKHDLIKHRETIDDDKSLDLHNNYVDQNIQKYNISPEKSLILLNGKDPELLNFYNQSYIKEQINYNQVYVDKIEKDSENQKDINTLNLKNSMNLNINYNDQCFEMKKNLSGNNHNIENLKVTNKDLNNDKERTLLNNSRKSKKKLKDITLERKPVHPQNEIFLNSPKSINKDHKRPKTDEKEKKKNLLSNQNSNDKKNEIKDSNKLYLKNIENKSINNENDDFQILSDIDIKNHKLKLSLNSRNPNQKLTNPKLITTCEKNKSKDLFNPKKKTKEKIHLYNQSECYLKTKDSDLKKIKNLNKILNTENQLKKDGSDKINLEIKDSNLSKTQEGEHELAINKDQINDNQLNGKTNNQMTDCKKKEYDDKKFVIKTHFQNPESYYNLDNENESENSIKEINNLSNNSEKNYNLNEELSNEIKIHSNKNLNSFLNQKNQNNIKYLIDKNQLRDNFQANYSNIQENFNSLEQKSKSKTEFNSKNNSFSLSNNLEYEKVSKTKDLRNIEIFDSFNQKFSTSKIETTKPNVISKFNDNKKSSKEQITIKVKHLKNLIKTENTSMLVVDKKQNNQNKNPFNRNKNDTKKLIKDKSFSPDLKKLNKSSLLDHLNSNEKSARHSLSNFIDKDDLICSPNLKENEIDKPNIDKFTNTSRESKKDLEDTDRKDKQNKKVGHGQSKSNEKHAFTVKQAEKEMSKIKKDNLNKTADYLKSNEEILNTKEINLKTKTNKKQNSKIKSNSKYLNLVEINSNKKKNKESEKNSKNRSSSLQVKRNSNLSISDSNLDSSENNKFKIFDLIKKEEIKKEKDSTLGNQGDIKNSLFFSFENKLIKSISEDHEENINPLHNTVINCKIGFSEKTKNSFDQSNNEKIKQNDISKFKDRTLKFQIINKESNNKSSISDSTKLELIKHNMIDKSSLNENYTIHSNKKIKNTNKLKNIHYKSIDGIAKEETTNLNNKLYIRKIGMQENSIDNKNFTESIKSDKLNEEEIKLNSNQDLMKKNNNDMTENMGEKINFKKIDNINNLYITTDILSPDEFMKFSFRTSKLEKVVEITKGYSTFEKIKITDLNDNPYKLIDEILMHQDKNGQIIKIIKTISDVKNSIVKQEKNLAIIETYIQKEVEQIFKEDDKNYKIDEKKNSKLRDYNKIETKDMNNKNIVNELSLKEKNKIKKTEKTKIIENSYQKTNSSQEKKRVFKKTKKVESSDSCSNKYFNTEDNEIRPNNNIEIPKLNNVQEENKIKENLDENKNIKLEPKPLISKINQMYNNKELNNNQKKELISVLKDEENIKKTDEIEIIFSKKIIEKKLDSTIIKKNQENLDVKFKCPSKNEFNSDFEQLQNFFESKSDEIYKNSSDLYYKKETRSATFNHKNNSITKNIPRDCDINFSINDLDKLNSDEKIVEIDNELEDDEGLFPIKIEFNENLMRKYREKVEKFKEMAQDSVKKEKQLKDLAQSIQNLISKS